MSSSEEEMIRRIRSDMLDSYDEELEMELDDHNQDELADGLSSVYTFFDPLVEKACFGTWNILWQVAEARKRGLPYVYLGYWIEDSSKMRYKSSFQPHQRLVSGEWMNSNFT